MKDVLNKYKCFCGLGTTSHIMRFNLPCTDKYMEWASFTAMKVKGMCLNPNSCLAVVVVLHHRMAQPKKADSWWWGITLD